MRLYAIYITLAFFSFFCKVSAQDLSWGFEEWEVVDGIETLSHWDVNNYSNGLDTLIARFYKDSIDFVEGNYSLRAIKDPIITSAFFNCTSMASLYQELTVPIPSNQSVYFSFKSQALTDFPETYINVIVGFSEGNEFLGRVEWNNYEEILDWQEVEVPIPFDGGTAMSIQINSASQNGATDGCHLESIVWIDDLRISESSTNIITNKEIENIQMYPNPSQGIVTLNTSRFNGASYKISDLFGRDIMYGIVNDETIDLKYIGLNIIRIYNESGEANLFKVLNLRGYE